MKDYLYSELVNAITEAGLASGLVVRSDVRVTWNQLRARDASIDLGWYAVETGRLVAAWIVRETASDPKVASYSRWTSTRLFEGCPAVLKIEVSSTRALQRVTCATEASILHVAAREIAGPGVSRTLAWLTSLTSAAATLLNPWPHGLWTFLEAQLPDALPLIRRNLLPFSRGFGHGDGVSSHPGLIASRWLDSESAFMNARSVPDDFYAIGVAHANAEECIFVMWGGDRRFWFREPYESFFEGAASLERMRQRFDLKLHLWAQELLAELDQAS